MRTNSSSALILRCSDSMIGWLLGGLALLLQILDGAQAELDLVVDVLRDQRHFLDDLLLVVELREGVLQLAVELPEVARGALSRSGLGRLALPVRRTCRPPAGRASRTSLTSLRRPRRCFSRLSIFLSRITRSKRSLGGSEISFSARAMCSLPAKPKL